MQADFGAFDLVGFRAKDGGPASRAGSTWLWCAARRPGLADVQALIAGMPLQAARERLKDIPLGSEDVLSFQLSGGTTGVPKIIPRFHAEYLGHSAAWMRRYRIDANSRVIWSLPLLHNAGQLYTLVPAALMGVSVVLMSKSTSRACWN